jgi:aerobic carbon-monoxide dehydrogenase medium subunit
MKPAPFEYERPASLDAVLALLASRRGQAKIIAGGQSLVPMMNFRVAQPELLVDINRVGGLDYQRVEGNELAIGALSRHATLAASEVVAKACPLMHAAYEWVAHGPVRNRGTLCGNLCHADPASEMPAVVQAVDATLVLRSSSGERKVAAAGFFVGLYETAVRADEMLVEVRIPVAPAGQGWGFHEVSVRKGDFAIVAACATLQIKAGAVSAAAIAVAGCGAHAQRLRGVEQTLVGRKPDATVLSEAAASAAAAVNPGSDMHGNAEYRRDLVRALVARALADAREHCA